MLKPHFSPNRQVPGIAESKKVLIFASEFKQRQMRAALEQKPRYFPF
jgi:hypothetical protein